MNPHYLYLTVDLAVLAVPLAFSFDRKVRFARFWPALFPVIAVMMALFIPWLGQNKGLCHPVPRLAGSPKV